MAEQTRTPTPARLRPIRVTWYALTLFAAVAALFVSDPLANAVARGAVAREWMFVPPALFVLLFAGYAVDRWRLVQAGRYASGRAIAQTVFGVVFASVLLSATVSNYRGHPPQGADRLLLHPDAEVRATAVYALGFRGHSAESVERVLPRLDDRSPDVRAAAAEVLARWSRREPSDLAGIRAWAAAPSATSTTSEGQPR